MRADVRDRYEWQRGLIPIIKQILANYLIVEAPFEEDARRNTDLMVLKAEVTRVACRVRTHGYASRYGDEFTLRSRYDSGSDAELPKVLSGWGDYIFYSFANDDGTNLVAWLLGDLRVFRLWHHRQLARQCGRLPGCEKPNGDGSWLRAYQIDDLPPDFVLARRRYVVEAA